MRLDSNQLKSVRTRAKHLLCRRRFKEAVELLSEAIKHSPRCYKLLRLRALANACLHDYAASIADTEQLISLVPDYPDGYFFKGTIDNRFEKDEKIRQGYCLYHEGAYLKAGNAFAEGMKRTPFDRVMKQAFWDAVTLASQTRTNAASH